MTTNAFLKSAIIALGVFGISSLCKAANAEVDWSADGNIWTENNNTTLLSPGDLVLIGSFNESFAAIQLNPNPSSWINNFAQFGQTTIGTGVAGAPGEWAAITQASSSGTTPFPVANQRIYVVVFNASLISSATQEAILSLSSDATHSSPSGTWIFPGDITPNNKTVIDVQDLTSGGLGTEVLRTNADVVWGAFDAANQNFATEPFTVVPEPSTWVTAALTAFTFIRLSGRKGRFGWTKKPRICYKGK